MACPLCLSDQTRPLFAIGDFTIHRCHSCTGGFAEPRLSPGDSQDVYSTDYFETYHAGPMEGPAFAAARYKRLDRMIDLHPNVSPQGSQSRPSMLDVGCASGYLLSLFQRDGWQATGIELSHAAAQFGREELGLQIVEGDFVHTYLPAEKYDLITMFHVIEHFPDPRIAVEKAHDLLSERGVLFVETPNWDGVGALLRGSQWSHYIPPEHLNFFGPRSLGRMLRSHGFDRIQVDTFTPPILEGVDALPRGFQALARALYRAAGLVGRGPSLQAAAILPQTQAARD